jgi:hypothetical protein
MTAPQTTTEKASVRIDGTAVDPCNVIAGSPAGLLSGHDIEVHIAAKILLHELQQCGVEVSEHTLRDFVATDARDERARDTYLTIARFVISPLPRQKFFLGVFRPRNPARHTLTPRWAWTEASGVQLRDDTIILSGRASDV